MKYKILLFAAGKNAFDFMKQRSEIKYLRDDEIVGFVDNDSSKQGTYLKDVLISNPQQIKRMSWDYIVITANNFENIKEQLIEKFDIAEEQILTLEEYRNKKFLSFQFEKNNQINQLHSAEYVRKFNAKSTVIYTAIIGDYDDLKIPKCTNSDVDYICFTDNRELQSEVWDIRYVDNTEQIKSSMLARQYKLLPHRFLGEYDTSIWVDANVEICDDLTKYMVEYQRCSDFLLFPHYQRDCIYDEGAVCILLKKDSKEALIKQMSRYMLEGHPQNGGLLCGGCLVRNHNEPTVIKVMEDWWQEVISESARDQISLPYVLKKNNFHYDICDLSLLDNKWLKWCIIHKKH